jgi:hypothetical protein
MNISKSVNKIKKTRGLLYLKTLFIIAGILTVGGVLLYSYIAKGFSIKKPFLATVTGENIIAASSQESSNKPSPTITTNENNKTEPSQESNNVRIIFLHHSTGGKIWSGGVPQLIKEYNLNNKTNYQISEQNYPSTKGGYPWSNYPYDYYNLWVKHTGDSHDKKELNLDQIAANYDVIIFKHCFPVSEIKADTGKPNINSNRKSLENYKLQYNALRDRMLQFPDKKFIVWTGAALSEDSTTPEQAKRSKEWADWVRSEWDKTDDNIFIFDFEQLETEGGLYFKYPSKPKDSHPDTNFSKTAASEFVKRVIEVIQVVTTL